MLSWGKGGWAVTCENVAFGLAGDLKAVIVVGVGG